MALQCFTSLTYNYQGKTLQGYLTEQFKDLKHPKLKYFSLLLNYFITEKYKKINLGSGVS
jgi:hypothetical protein